jgi:hypothetical protein
MGGIMLLFEMNWLAMLNKKQPCRVESGLACHLLDCWKQVAVKVKVLVMVSPWLQSFFIYFSVLRTEPRVLCMLGKCSTTEILPQLPVAQAVLEFAIFLPQP